MDKIQIVNWLLTRRCNLHCDYCRIVKDYKGKPAEYPNLNYYIKHEMTTDFIIDCLNKFKLHNPNCFHILYGGEPLLRPDLYKIINHCNDNNIHYTIISNNSDRVQESMKKLLDQVSFIEGFTASIDPIIYQNIDNDIFKKSFAGLQKLTEYSRIIKDVVAEITVTNENLDYLYLLVKELTSRGINSDITFVDIAKSQYYDFSNITDESILVQKGQRVRDILNRIIAEKLNVHMRDTLLAKIYENLPSEYDCKIEKNLHTICVDSDGGLRLCLRISGSNSKRIPHVLSLFGEDAEIRQNVKNLILTDKREYCKKCNHSCYMMGEMISNNEENSNNLIHSEIRS